MKNNMIKSITNLSLAVLMSSVVLSGCGQRAADTADSGEQTEIISGSEDAGDQSSAATGDAPDQSAADAGDAGGQTGDLSDAAEGKGSDIPETSASGNAVTGISASDEATGSAGDEEAEAQSPDVDRAGKYTMTMEDEIGGEKVTAEYYVELREDHTGVMSMQDDIDIVWDDREITPASGQDGYEYSIEDGVLHLNLDGMWMEFTKEL